MEHILYHLNQYRQSYTVINAHCQWIRKIGGLQLKGRCVRSVVEKSKKIDGLFIQAFTAKQDYPCINCKKRTMDKHKIDCLCTKIDDWNEALAKEINKCKS